MKHPKSFLNFNKAPHPACMHVSLAVSQISRDFYSRAYMHQVSSGHNAFLCCESLKGTVEKTLSFATKGGWTPFRQREFMFFGVGKTWEEAETTCVQYGANLASVHSESEDAFIKRLISSQAGYDRNSWLGGYNSHVVPSRWYWTDESYFDFATWTQGQPDGSGHCLQTNFRGGWDDLPCNYNISFVCARPITKGAETAVPNDAQLHSAAGTVEKTLSFDTNGGWTQFGQREFMYFGVGKTWEEAETTCVQYGANLASVHSESEDAFIKRLISSQAGYDRNSWLGGYNSHVVPSRWYWTDESYFDFATWTQGQPDGSGHCLQTNFRGGWDDLPCNYNIAFVCARQITKGSVGDEQPALKASDWKPFGSHLYKLFTMQKSWKDAKGICEQNDASLASVHNNNENNFIMSLFSGQAGTVWLGGYYEPGLDQWRWSDFSEFDHTNWSQGEPNGSGNCLQIYSNGRWDDFHCHVALNFVCAK
ncbi:hypothetical protein MHYP_G00264100 [Metynnis hypsauchen]